jgi:hypothetical protein
MDRDACVTRAARRCCASSFNSELVIGVPVIVYRFIYRTRVDSSVFVSICCISWLLDCVKPPFSLRRSI